MKGLSINFITCGLLVLSILFTPTNTDGQQKSSKLDNQKIEKFRRLERQYEGFPEMIRSNKAAWLTSRGNYYGEKGNLDKAISSFKEAISIKNDFTPAYISLGIAYREKGMHQEGLAILNKAPRKVRINGQELGGYEFDLYNAIVSVYLAMGNKSKALEYAKKALEAVNDPKRKEQIEFAKRAGIIEGSSDSEIILLLKGLIAEDYLDRGFTYYKLGNYERAITVYSKAIELDLKYIQAYLYRGMAYFKLGNYQQAIKNYDKVIELNPENADAYVLRGGIYEILGKYRQLIDDFKKAARLGNKHAKEFLISEGVDW